MNFSCWFKFHASQVLCDIECGKVFILCEYNRDADSYRSASVIIFLLNFW